MERVQQEQKGDCGPACIAMVLGVPLRDILGDFSEARERGVTSIEMVDYLTNKGVPALESLVWPDLSVPAILTVPSLNHAGVLHFIVWDGNRYLDPSGPLRYPNDGPEVFGERRPQWSSVILLWPDSKKQTLNCPTQGA